jgi:hypothetical protein
MSWIDLFVVFVFALILGSLMTWGFGWRHPARSEAVGASLFFLVLVLFFMMWTGRAWLPPWGPVWFGTTWLDILLIGIFTALLVLAVATPVRRPRSKREEIEAPSTSETAALTIFGLFFWLLIGGLFVAALVGLLS